ncbi:MAG: macro domain-containing protein [Bacteroidales bacterium]|jgi:O-acetyl-ADP-ribose deacetylase (regulator of RNase III)|nr:macro domain-containing protein [Bacteroidales bacterium]
MIKYVIGDMLSAKTEALVNTVNTVGVMGKGIALQFKEQYPNNFAAYNAACKSNQITIGNMFVFEEKPMIGDKKIIINFPTKKDWKHKSKIEYVEDGLKSLVEIIKKHNIKSIALPPLGCGNGGLNWNDVKALIEKYLSPLNYVNIIVYEPNAAIKDILIKQENNREVKLTDARAMLMYAMYYYESLDETASIFVANKLAYFYQRLGESEFSKLKFSAEKYGPYSPGVGYMIHSLNGKYIRGTEQMINKAFEPIELRYDKLSEVSQYVHKMNDEKQRRVKNLLKLIAGFQSTLALEILASVDYVRKENQGISKEDATIAVQNWSNRKRNLFKPEYISRAYDRLEYYANTIKLV